MEDILKYEKIIKTLLEEYAHDWSKGGQLDFGVLFDSERHRYQLISIGWMGDEYIHHVPIHIDIKNNKIWLQKNMTEEYVAEALVARGIPPKSIVLGLQPPEYRKYTAYAEA